MALPVKVRGLDRIQPYLDKLSNGYTQTGRMHLWICGDSYVNAVGSVAPEEHGFAAVITKTMKDLAGDGGSFLSSYYSHQIWNRESTDGRGQFGLRDHYWNDSETVNGLQLYLTKTWTGGGAANAWVSDGGFGGWYIKFYAAQTPWIASSQAYISVNAAGNQYTLTDINGTSGATEPTWAGTSGSFTVDNDLKWFDLGAAAGTEALYATSTAYTKGAIVRTTSGRKLRLDAGKTGATAPTWPVGPGLTVTDGSAIWTYSGPSLKNVPLPSGDRYRLVHKRDTAAGKVTVQFKQAVAGYPYAIDATATADEWGHVTALPDAAVDAYRTMIFDRTSGTWSAEGAIVLHDEDTGLIDYRVGVSGRAIKAIDDALLGNATRQDAFVGKNVIPNTEPVLVVLELGINDYNAAMGSITDLAVAEAGIKRLIQYYTNAFLDCYFVFVVTPPWSAGGVPLPGDTQYDYMQGIADAAYNATTASGALAKVCVMDCSQVYGATTAATSKTAGFLCGDGLHPSDLGHSYLARAIVQGLGLPGTAIPTTALTEADRDYLDAKFAAIAASGPDSTKIDQIHKATFGKKVKTGGAVPTAFEILDPDDDTRVVKWGITPNPETWTPE